MKTFAAALSLALAAAVSAREFETYDKFVAKAGKAEEMPLFAGLQVDGHGDDDNEGKKKESKKDNKRDNKSSTASAKKDDSKNKRDNKSSTTSSGDSKNKRNNSSSSTSSSSSSSTSSSDKRKYSRSGLGFKACQCDKIKKRSADKQFCKDLWEDICEDYSSSKGTSGSSDLEDKCDYYGSEDCWQKEEEMPLFAGLTGDGDDGKKEKAKRTKDTKKEKKDTKKDNKSESKKKDTKKEKKDAKKDNKSSSTSSSETKKKRNDSSSSSSSSSSSTSSSDKRKRSVCDGRGRYACECEGMEKEDKKWCKKLWEDECEGSSFSTDYDDECYICGSEDCWSDEEVANLRGNVAAVE